MAFLVEKNVLEQVSSTQGHMEQLRSQGWNLPSAHKSKDYTCNTLSMAYKKHTIRNGIVPPFSLLLAEKKI